MDNLMTVAAVMLAAAGLIVLSLIWIVRERRTINPMSPQQIGDLIRRLDEAVARAQARLADIQRLTGSLPEAPAAPPAPAQAPRPSLESLLPPPRLEPQQGEVLRLHQQGLEMVEIARRLDLTVGEVELTLNLAKSLGRYVPAKAAAKVD